MTKFLPLFCLLFIQFRLLAQEAIVLRGANDLVDLKMAALYVGEDPGAALGIGEVTNRLGPFLFSPLGQALPNFGITTSAVWLKFRVDNQSGQPAYLEIRNPNIARLILYQRQVSGQWQADTLGTQQCFNDRPVSASTFQFPLLHQVGPEDYYLRAQTGRTMLLPMRVGTRYAFTSANHQHDFLFGISYGMLLIVIIYNLYFYLTLGESVYLYYVISILGMSLAAANLTGHSFEYLWPNHPWLNQYVPLMNSLGGLTILWFTARFIELQTRSPFWYRSYWLTSLFIILAGLTNLYSESLSHILVLALWLAVFVVTFFSVLVVYRQGYRLALFFVIARTIFFSSLSIAILSSKGLWSGHLVVVLYSLPIGLAVEMVVYAVALAQKLREYRHAMKQSAAAQANTFLENQQLIERQKTELEEKVRQRTAALGLSQQELNNKYQELAQGQEEILAQRNALKVQNKVQEHLHRRLSANEQVLRKAYLKLKMSEEKGREQNEELKKTNDKLNKSIEAAKVIQQAILPYELKANLLLKEYFVIFRPRDVVSGDFFWLNKINGITVLAAVDCTGHGVPGAFMSLIANTLLDKIVRVWQVTNPAEILTMLNEEVAIVLRQRETGNSEGMDVCICAWEASRDLVHLTFAGAKRPLYYVEADSNILKTIKPDRLSIGGTIQGDKFFTPHSLSLDHGCRLYLTSDGFVDQSNRDRVRFGSQRLETLLAQCHHLPMTDQCNVISQALDQFQAGGDQRDDILVIGVHL